MRPFASGKSHGAVSFEDALERVDHLSTSNDSGDLMWFVLSLFGMTLHVLC